MRISSISYFAAVVLVATGGRPAAADVFSAVGDFSTTTNTDASTWSYRYSADLIRDGSYTLFPTYGASFNTWTPTNPGFWNVANAFAPYVGVNLTGAGSTYVTGPAFTLPAGQMLIHPGTFPATGLVVVSWLAPESGPLDISFRFADLDPNGGDGVSWFVERNSGAQTLASGSLFNNGTGPLSLTGVGVNAGDRINFVVAGNGNNLFDSTRLDATIQTIAPTDAPAAAVPEPTSALLLAAGVMTALRLGRRRSSLVPTDPEPA